jgi:hypothetical protein
VTFCFKQLCFLAKSLNWHVKLLKMCKTITVALSQKRAVAFQRAISANRQIEEALSRLRQVSQAALLAEVPGVTQRRLDVPQNTEAKSVPKGP